MTRSLADVKKEQKEKYKTAGQTLQDFKIGDRVKVIVPCQDFHFFDGETGVVTEIKEGIYGIKIKFDQPRHYKEWTMYDFCFEPEDLLTFENYKELFEKW